jgi:hypothetical protein
MAGHKVQRGPSAWRLYAFVGADSKGRRSCGGTRWDARQKWNLCSIVPTQSGSLRSGSTRSTIATPKVPPRSKPTTYPAPSPPDCSGDHAVKDNIDGEAKPLVAIAGDHLRGVGGDNWEPV